MLDRVAKLFAKQPEREGQQMSANPPAAANGNTVVTEQPAAKQEMTADNSDDAVGMRGGRGGGEICCGICAGLACFECCEICC